MMMRPESMDMDAGGGCGSSSAKARRPPVYSGSMLASSAAFAACNYAIQRLSDATSSSRRSSSSSSGLSRLSSDRGSNGTSSSSISDLFWRFYQYQEMLCTLGPDKGSAAFCRASNCSINNGHDDRDLERLLRQLDVGWVLLLDAADDGDAAGCSRQQQQQLRHLTSTWLRALAEILHTYSYCFQFQHTTVTVPVAGARNFFCVMHRRYWEEGSTPAKLKFMSFAAAAISKMLPFLDSISSCQPPAASNNAAALLPAEKLQALIQVWGALSRICGMTELRSPESSPEVASVHDELLGLLSAKLVKLDEAVWNTMKEVIISARLISSTEEGDDRALHGSSDIHKMTRSVLSYINLLETDHGLEHRIVYQAAKLRKFAPAIGNIGTLPSLKLQMIDCLEQKLYGESRSFPDQSLRYLLLINNLHFVQQQFSPMFDMKSHMPVLTSKINQYIQEFLQVSWAPVLSCLHSPAPHCLGRFSPLPNFESEFHKTYTTQKLWKVPDPELRRRLRKAVIDKLTPRFTEYLQDNTAIAQGITLTPQELEVMLQELFEG